MKTNKILDMFIDGIHNTSNDGYAFKKEENKEIKLETKQIFNYPNKFKTFSTIDKNHYFYGRRFIKFMIDENGNILGIDNKKDLYFGKISYDYILSIYRTNRFFGEESKLVYTECKLNNGTDSLCENSFYIEPFWKVVEDCNDYKLQEFGCDSIVYYEIQSERIKDIKKEIEASTIDSLFEVDFSNSNHKKDLNDSKFTLSKNLKI